MTLRCGQGRPTRQRERNLEEFEGTARNRALLFDVIKYFYFHDSRRVKWIRHGTRIE